MCDLDALGGMQSALVANAAHLAVLGGDQRDAVDLTKVVLEVGAQWEVREVRARVDAAVHHADDLAEHHVLVLLLELREHLLVRALAQRAVQVALHGRLGEVPV